MSTLQVEQYGRNIHIKGCDRVGTFSTDLLSQYGEFEVQRSEDNTNIHFLGNERSAHKNSALAYKKLLRHLKENGYDVNPKELDPFFQITVVSTLVH
jgi:hypothetical protein